jgi:inner membrane protein
MATPIGHSLAGYAIYRALVPAEDRRPALALFAAAMAIAPDLDFVPGILAGAPATYHQGLSHSLALGIIAGLTGTVVLRAFADTTARVGFLLGFLCYASHLFIDLFGPDARPPYGIPLFWPLSDHTFLSPVPLLLGVSHAGRTSASTSEWLIAILSLYNVAAIGLEIALILPFVLLARRRRAQPTRSTCAESSARVP